MVFQFPGADREFDVPVQEIALQATEAPPEFVVTEEVQRTLRNEEEDPDLEPPVIDVGPLFDVPVADEGARHGVASEIGRASEEWGFFQVVNHGIPESLVEGALGVVQEFFSMPLTERKLYTMKPGASQGYGRRMKPKIRPWSDSFRHQLRPQPFPDQDIRPAETPASYREITNQYAEEVAKLVRTLTAVLSEYVGLELNALQNALAKEWDDYPAMMMTANLYPKCPQPDSVLGIYPHSDAGAMTVLSQNDVDGLQVLKGGKWVTVKARKNALIINVGDQLEILTNGRLKSIKHRAVVNASAARISIATFCRPGSPDIVIGPLPQFDQETDNSKYSYVAMTFSDYVSAYFNRDMDAKPLGLISS